MSKTFLDADMDAEMEEMEKEDEGIYLISTQSFEILEILPLVLC